MAEVELELYYFKDDLQKLSDIQKLRLKENIMLVIAAQREHDDGLAKQRRAKRTFSFIDFSILLLTLFITCMLTLEFGGAYKVQFDESTSSLNFEIFDIQLYIYLIRTTLISPLVIALAYLIYYRVDLNSQKLKKSKSAMTYCIKDWRENINTMNERRLELEKELGIKVYYSRRYY